MVFNATFNNISVRGRQFYWFEETRGPGENYRNKMNINEIKFE
jgi:hypothetical protein